jgi:glutaredoxin-related protein
MSGITVIMAGASISYVHAEFKISEIVNEVLDIKRQCSFGDNSDFHDHYTQLVTLGIYTISDNDGDMVLNKKVCQVMNKARKWEGSWGVYVHIICGVGNILLYPQYTVRHI